MVLRSDNFGMGGFNFCLLIIYKPWLDPHGLVSWLCLLEMVCTNTKYEPHKARIAPAQESKNCMITSLWSFWNFAQGWMEGVSKSNSGWHTRSRSEIWRRGGMIHHVLFLRFLWKEVLSLYLCFIVWCCRRQGSARKSATKVRTMVIFCEDECVFSCYEMDI